jgi:hypothetical protein
VKRLKWPEQCNIFSCLTANIHRILLERLEQHGVNTEEAPALLRDLSNILESELALLMALTVHCDGVTENFV